MMTKMTKRKFLSLLAAIAMVCSLMSVPTNVYAADADDKAASIGDTQYASLQAAVDAAQDEAEITLLKDVTEDVTIENSKKVTLHLNGHTITNRASHTIYNKGTLTIDGNGTVDNVTHAKTALYNEVGATVVLNGGAYTRSKETGSSPEVSGKNSYYNVLNHGTMTINEGVVVEQSGKFSSLLANGWYNGSENTTKALSELTINGGTFDGGLNTIKNDDYGKLTINDGTFKNVAQAAFLNWNIAQVNGGTFSSDMNVILSGRLNADMDKGELEITGGTFTAGATYDVIGKMSGSNEDSLTYVKVSGGVFNTDVANFVIDGYRSVVKDGIYQVVPVTTGVSLDKTEIELTVGETAQLTATLKPAGAVENIIWSSADETIATVENGQIKAVGAGTTGITVQAGNYRATCYVTVKDVVDVEVPTIDPSKPVEEVTAGISGSDAEKTTNVITDTIKNMNKVEGNDEKVSAAVEEALQAGKNVDSEISVKKVTENEVVKVEKEAVEKAVEAIREDVKANTSTIAQYLDLSVLVKVDGEVLGNLNKLGEAVTFTVAVPQELQQEGRHFYVIRIHDDEVTRLPVTMHEDGTLSFTTDRFSTYALVYVDGAEEGYLQDSEVIGKVSEVTEPGEPSDPTEPIDPTVPNEPVKEPTKPTETVDKDEKPQTGMGSMMMAYGAVMLVSAGIVIVIRKKKELQAKR